MFSQDSHWKGPKVLKHLPEAAAVMHRSRANLAMWPSMPAVKSESEVLVDAWAGVSGVWSAGLMCPCPAAPRQWLWLWQPSSRQFHSLQVERSKEKKEKEKLEVGINEEDVMVAEDVSEHQSSLVQVTPTLSVCLKLAACRYFFYPPHTMKLSYAH